MYDARIIANLRSFGAAFHNGTNDQETPHIVSVTAAAATEDLAER